MCGIKREQLAAIVADRISTLKLPELQCQSEYDFQADGVNWNDAGLGGGGALIKRWAMTFSRAIIGFFALALASSAARAQTPLYTPPPTPAPAHPHPGAATPVLCVYWLQNNRSALNEPAGPGGRDPVVRVTGPSATTGSFGADNTTCRLTLIHASGMRETGWLTLRPSLRWTPEN